MSPRTLRYYDEIGLLKPAGTTESGYRLYGDAQVDMLQQILFYRELGMPLDSIKAIVTAPSFDRAAALRQHRAALLQRRAQLDLLIANVDKTIATIEGRGTMSDKEKFEGFKRQLIEENEAKYGKEVRERWGDDAVEKSNARVMSMTPEQYEQSTRLAAEVQSTLGAAFATGDPAGDLAQKAADLHRQWLSIWWDGYSKEAHAGLAQMYVEDERFRAYYDQGQPGKAEFFRDAILIYTGAKAK